MIVKPAFLAPALFVLVVSPAFSTESIREVVTEAIISGPLPGFDHGHLFFVDHPSNSVRLFAPDGHLLTGFESHPGVGRPASISSLVVDPAGTIATAWTSGPDGCGVDLHDFRGTLIGSFSTGTYCQVGLWFAEDHTLWSFGSEYFTRFSPPSPSFLTVRHYSLSGQQLAAFLPKSEFPEVAMVAYCCAWEAKIQVTRDRIGINAVTGPNSGVKQWVEMDLNGNVTGRWPIPGHVQGLTPVLTSDGQVYLSRIVPDAKAIRTFRLNRTQSTWDSVALPDGSVWGVDGTRLVFAQWTTGAMALRWFDQP